MVRRVLIGFEGMTESHRPARAPGAFVVTRVWNAARKLASGLPLGGEAVWPGVRNDLFVAHESIYRFAAAWAAGRRVLDAACGTGYGSVLLAQAGARSVTGVDLNRRRVSFAARTFRAPQLDFEVADCESLQFDDSSFDLVVSSNTLEHLHRPERFLRHASRLLSPDGRLIVAVPPVLSEADVRAHALNHAHVTNRSVREWSDLFLAEGWACRYFNHRCRRPLDFAAPHHSDVEATSFEFLEGDIGEAYVAAPITAIYLLRRAAL
jgi:2-polyprenyl-3-methyl-5-hydroxy-6-metoxy-1,4-benzoquinol methylase